ncbi:Mur ligase family CapB protein [Halomarina oriensis]|uniref:Mur ligase family CapB protein n=1 Tax=Halomarina oriensis TaxID=671145 RepID=UPI0018EF1F1F|nr:Mur ligase family CapB protein [Halomarina oriensis]
MSESPEPPVVDQPPDEFPTDDTAFEVYERGDGWHWRLVDEDVPLAYGALSLSTPADAAASVDRVRALASDTAVVTGRAAFEVGRTDTEAFDWRLVDADETALAVGVVARDEEATVTTDVARFRAAAETATVALRRPPESRRAIDADSLVVGERAALGETLRSVGSLFTRGRRHRSLLDSIEKRIVVSGIRGKSSTVRRLDDIFGRRGYDTLTKITGNHPVTIHNGTVVPIDRRGTRTTLYENVPLLGQFGDWFEGNERGDVAIVENQGITEYTTRLVNERFVRPHVVVLTNVRQDHTDTLGPDRQTLARTFARTIPEGTHVVSGEQHPVLHDYLREEVERRGATIEQVEVPDRHRGLLGAETVHALDAVLRAFDVRGLSDRQLDAYLDGAQPEWLDTPDGRVFNGAEINDIESTEMIRRALAGDERVLPFVYLRADRRGRTASFVEYLNVLADRGRIDRARVGGANTGVFARNVDVPCTTHGRDEDAGAVLDEMLAEGDPVLLMGNTVDEFMREMERAIATRAADYDTFDDADPAETPTLDVPEPVTSQHLADDD